MFGYVKYVVQSHYVYAVIRDYYTFWCQTLIELTVGIELKLPPYIGIL